MSLAIERPFAQLTPTTHESVQNIEGRPPQWLVNRAETYKVGVRRKASTPTAPPNRPFPLLTTAEQQQHILAAESLGPISDDQNSFWQTSLVLFPYSPDHVMVIPRQTEPLISSLQSVDGDRQGWNDHLREVFSIAGKCLNNFSSHDAGNPVFENIFGVNAGKNQSLGFLHFHLVRLHNHDWTEVPYRQIPESLPHRKALLQENIGCYGPAEWIIHILSSEFPHLLDGSYAMTKGASIFAELAVPTEELMQSSEFAEFMIRADEVIRWAHGQAHIPADQQCHSMLVGQQVDQQRGFFAFQIAAKIGAKPSGVMETANYAFWDVVDYDRLRIQAPEEQLADYFFKATLLQGLLREGVMH